MTEVYVKMTKLYVITVNAVSYQQKICANSFCHNYHIHLSQQIISKSAIKIYCKNSKVKLY